jgi:hypothetical protein
MLSLHWMGRHFSFSVQRRINKHLLNKNLLAKYCGEKSWKMLNRLLWIYYSNVELFPTTLKKKEFPTFSHFFHLNLGKYGKVGDKK